MCVGVYQGPWWLYSVNASRTLYDCLWTYISCDHTHTRIIPDYAVATKSFVSAAQAGWLFAKGQSWLQMTSDGWPRLEMDLNALCVYPHTCSPTDGRDCRAHSHFVTPQETLSPLPVWGIDEVVPLSEFAVISPGSLLKMSNLSQRVSQGWLPTQAEANTQHCTLCHANDQFSCFCVIYQIAWACDEWAQISKGGKKDIYFALGRCYAHVTA